MVLVNGEGKKPTKEDKEMIEKVLDDNKAKQEESSTKTIGAQNQEMAARNIQKNDGTVLALIGVIVALIFGIVVYAIVSYYRKQQNEQLVKPRNHKYIEQRTFTTEMGLSKESSIAELPDQFDVQKELRGMRTPGTDSKMLDF